MSLRKSTGIPVSTTAIAVPGSMKTFLNQWSARRSLRYGTNLTVYAPARNHVVAIVQPGNCELDVGDVVLGSAAR
jgi:hypothetical protein